MNAPAFPPAAGRGPGLLLLACLALALGPGAASPALAEDAFLPAGLGSQASGNLSLGIDRLAHDFGVQEQDTAATTTFRYRNETNEALERVTIGYSCGCIIAKIDKRRLAPGEIGTLHVEFQTTNQSGKMTKTVELHTGVPNEGKIVLELSIAIVGGLIIEPGHVNFGDVREGTLPETTIAAKWMEGAGEPFEITEARVPGREDIEVRVLPLPESAEAWRGHEIRLRFTEAPPLGFISAQLLVRTTHPKRKRLVLMVNGNVCGPVWITTRSVDFSNVRQGRPRTYTLQFHPFDDSIEFGEVRARAVQGKVQVELQRKAAALDPSGRHWNLRITVPADAPVGNLEGERVLLDVGIPGEPPVEIEVKGKVRG